VAPRWGKLTRHHHPAASVLLATVLVVVLIWVGDLGTAVALSNVAAIIAMLIVNVAAYKLARRRWPAPGMRLRGGVALPVVAFLTAAAQLPSLGWANVALGTAMVFAGLFIYALRHRPELATDPDPMLRAIEELETPVARALRRRGKGNPAAPVRDLRG
jgi:APA family basic amino acid/polyamine antiporter